MNIGDWIQREKRGVPHLVESIVSGDVVTKCGRRLADEPTKSGGELRLADMPLPYGKHLCLVCDPY